MFCYCRKMKLKVLLVVHTNPVVFIWPIIQHHLTQPPLIRLSDNTGVFFANYTGVNVIFAVDSFATVMLCLDLQFPHKKGKHFTFMVRKSFPGLKPSH